MNELILHEIAADRKIDRWNDLIEKGKKNFATSLPFPFIIMDNFLDGDMASEAARDFPAANEKTWTNYIHVNEKKYGLNKKENIPASLLKIISDLQGNDFLEKLSGITGMTSLIADEQLAGGGLHQTQPGGFLNIHSDFLIHPTKANLMRRINLILFLSPDWKEDYGGELQFWNKDMTECVVRIQPKFNRCVIFRTDEDAFHGCPDKLGGPPGFSRKSLALYYYSEFSTPPAKQYTDYQARPEDGHKRLAIFLDNKAIALYSWIKQKFKLNDDFISRVLRIIKWR